MVEVSEGVFEKLNCIQLKNDLISIWVTKDIGPRILGLSLIEGENLLVVLPDSKLPVEGEDYYSLRGGHRLWYGPENPKTTYITDDRQVEIDNIKNGLNIIQPTDQKTKIQKSWQVTMDKKEALVTIDHKLTNLGEELFELAPWAITMLNPGGWGLIPLQKESDDDYGLWPNRQVVFWPYTDVNSPHLQWDNQAILIHANMNEGALKVGTPNPAGWIAYALNGTLFVKKAKYDSEATYLDRGASSQIYCNPDLIELETLGPVVKLSAGESVKHQENWLVYPDGKWPEEVKILFKVFGD